MRSFAPWPGRLRRILRAFTHAAGRLLIPALLLIVGIQPAFGADKSLTFGVFPHLTAKNIVETYHPLADVLDKRLQRPVVIYTARDFKTFVERTRQGEYDILLTAPHLAWLARQDAGYRPLLKYTQPVHGLMVVRSDSPFETPGALYGRTIARSDPLAVAALALDAELAAHGLRHTIDYQTTDSGTHLNAAMQVINGRADAAMIGLHPYKLIPPELRRQVRVLAETPSLSSLMYLAHPRLGDAEARAVRQALREFAVSPAGQAFMQSGGYGGFAEVNGHELRAFRPYALQAQDILRSTR
ncbi:MAG: phosphate/phosphite/phosphonate ABC transporter substrate-binding protein [Thiobacillus sp.]